MLRANQNKFSAEFFSCRVQKCITDFGAVCRAPTHPIRHRFYDKLSTKIVCLRPSTSRNICQSYRKHAILLNYCYVLMDKTSIKVPALVVLTHNRRNRMSINPALLEYQRIEDDNRPNSLVECLDEDGDINENKYILYKQKEAELDDAQDQINESIIREEESNVEEPKPKNRSPRKHKSLKPFFIGDNGKIVYLNPRQTFWYLCYVQSAEEHLANPTDKFKRKFRRRFRMPFEEYRSLFRSRSSLVRSVVAADPFFLLMPSILFRSTLVLSVVFG